MKERLESLEVEELPKLDFKMIEKDVSRETMSIFIQKLCAEQLSYFFTETKKEFILPQEWEYDKSGDVKDTHKKFKISDYSNFGEFLEEYTGQWTATFERGYGKRWNIYYDDIQTEIGCEFYKIHRKKTADFLNIEYNDKTDNILFDYYDLYDHEIYEDLVLPLEDELEDLLDIEKKKSLFIVIREYQEKGFLNKNFEFIKKVEENE